MAAPLNERQFKSTKGIAQANGTALILILEGDTCKESRIMKRPFPVTGFCLALLVFFYLSSPAETQDQAHKDSLEKALAAGGDYPVGSPGRGGETGAFDYR